MKIQPIHDRVLVQRIEVEDKKGSIFIPEMAKEKPQRGLVIALGEGAILENGTVRPMALKQGDEVLFGKYAGTEISISDETYLLMREDDILAVIKD